MSMKQGSILSLAVLSEVFLIIVASIIAWLCDLSIEWNATPEAIRIGALAALPLLVGNHLLWLWTARHPESVYARFSRDIIVPLCKRISPGQAAIIGLLSGVGEEILFRGSLNQLCIRYSGELAALCLTSVAFAYVHFIGNIKRFGGMIPLYTAIGGVLWGVWFATGSLAAAATTHAVYNFCAIVWIRRIAR
jgi:membrane protease YdiL (CAAX protease family)